MQKVMLALVASRWKLLVMCVTIFGHYVAAFDDVVSIHADKYELRY